jgi:hypothetical protein
LPGSKSRALAITMLPYRRANAITGGQSAGRFIHRPRLRPGARGAAGKVIHIAVTMQQTRVRMRRDANFG